MQIRDASKNVECKFYCQFLRLERGGARKVSAIGWLSLLVTDLGQEHREEAEAACDTNLVTLISF